MAQSAPEIALNTTGPEDKYLFDENAETFRPRNIQHTHFTKFNRSTYPNVQQFAGQVVEFVLKPTEFGDLMTDAYLALTLPQLPQPTGTTYSWTPWIGRALIEHVELRIGQVVVEVLDDNWYITKDQMFLSADGKLRLAQLINGGYNETQSWPATTSLNVIIPLELFFCRRGPPLPVCALTENISIKFFFRPQTWFTNYPNPIDFSNVRLITEEVLLTPEERLTYLEPQKINIQRIIGNPPNIQSNGSFSQDFLAYFPVSMIFWFVRPLVTTVDTRYNFGYTVAPGAPYTALTYFNGVTVNYTDTIKSIKIFLNAVDITEMFGTGQFFQFKVPMDHGLTVPSKNIYTYYFGWLDFKELNSETSKLVVQFDPTLTTDTSSKYALYTYYYGQQVLTIANGQATILYM
jgi:hypothetical protein